MNALQNFAFEEHLVRAVERAGEPWFAGKDVCTALGIKDHHQALETLDEDERGGYSIPTPSGDQMLIIVSEPGVYRLVFRSRKPEAERFKRWLAHDVLPQIRKHGRYEGTPEPFTVDDASLASLRARVELVREARAIFGPARAAALWRTLQLPEAPTIAAIAGGDAMDCLNYLLISMADDGRPIGMLLDRAMEDDADAAALLRLHGIRVVSDMVEVEGFIVSNTAPGLVRLFDGSPWRELGHMKALRRLVGAVSTGPMKYDGPRAARGTFIPATYLDSEARR